MRMELPDAAREFGEAAARSFERAGGIALARQPETGTAVAQERLAELGFADLDPRRGMDDAAAVAELCRVAGRVMLPFPVPSFSLRDDEGSPFALVAGRDALVSHGFVAKRWHVSDLDGRSFSAEPAVPLRSRLATSVARMRLTPSEVTTPEPVRALFLTLGSWTLLGVSQRALELAIAHVTSRRQFNRRLSEFQTVAHRIADASVRVEGLDVLSRYTLWRVLTSPEAALVDALSLRLEGLSVAKEVLRTSQQLHGAAGMANEYEIAVLVRLAQPLIRLPTDELATLALLESQVEARGFAGAFGPADRS